jgi:hypothetical protein
LPPFATSADGVHAREPPTARFVPPAEFLTPLTAYSSLGLAGLFHPAATSGIFPSGVSPPVQPYHLVDGRLPRDVCPQPLPACLRNRAPQLRPRLQGLIPHGNSLPDAKGLALHLVRSPPGVFLLRVLPPPALPPPSRKLRSWSSFARPFTLVRTTDLQRLSNRRSDASLSRNADPLEVSGLPPATEAANDEASL